MVSQENVPSMSKCIPDFLPVIESESTIIPLIGFMMISLHLPPILKLREWKQLFSIEIDGTSMETFYDSVSENESTILLIQDEDDQIFGSFNTGTWYRQKAFFGDGQNFIFKFSVQRLQ